MNQLFQHFPVRPAIAGLTVLAGSLAGCDGGAPGLEMAAGVGEALSIEGGARTPHLSPTVDGALLSWWAPDPTATDGRDGPAPGPAAGDADGGADVWVLHTAPWTPTSGLGPVSEVTRGTDFFVNWADFPSATAVGPDHWVAHWLEREGEGTYAYGVRLAESRDGGASWSEPWIPHGDRTATEHGFASVLPHGGGWTVAWLDGRRYAEAPGRPATDEMQLRALTVPDASAAPGGGVEELLDALVCDCCQTDMALTDSGPVLVYRDRSSGEIRDIYVTRKWPGGVWTSPRPVHSDGWEISACPVNGPAVDAEGGRVAVVWFTGARDEPRVQLAFSSDAGTTFDRPIVVHGPAPEGGSASGDEGGDGAGMGVPLGRVDVVLLPGGDAVAVWMASSGEGARVLLRRVSRDGRVGPVEGVGETLASRASGFPQVVPVGDEHLLAAWTVPGDLRDPLDSRIDLRLLEIPE